MHCCFHSSRDGLSFQFLLCCPHTVAGLASLTMINTGDVRCSRHLCKDYKPSSSEWIYDCQIWKAVLKTKKGETQLVWTCRGRIMNILDKGYCGWSCSAGGKDGNHRKFMDAVESVGVTAIGWDLGRWPALCTPGGSSWKNRTGWCIGGGQATTRWCTGMFSLWAASVWYNGIQLNDIAWAQKSVAQILKMIWGPEFPQRHKRLQNET